MLEIVIHKSQKKFLIGVGLSYVLEWKKAEKKKCFKEV